MRNRNTASGHCLWPGCTISPMPDLPICDGHARQVQAKLHKMDVPDCGAERAMRQMSEDTKARTARLADAEGWIYYVLTDGHYKIGYTTNVEQRMKAYPPTSVLLAQHRGTKADERDLHRRFAAHRIAGREWFRADEDITGYIDAVVKIHGSCIDRFKARTGRNQVGQVRRRARVAVLG